MSHSYSRRSDSGIGDIRHTNSFISIGDNVIVGNERVGNELDAQENCSKIDVKQVYTFNAHSNPLVFNKGYAGIQSLLL